jgi:hypothetical protein
MNFSNQLKLKSVTLVAVVCATLSLLAADKNNSNPYLAQLSRATPMELPAQAAQLVAKSEAKARPLATVDVVKAALGLNPAAACQIVGCIAQAEPEMAPVAAGTAVSLVPDQAESIARVAAAAAPAQAGAIVAAICRVLPKQYKGVALAVAEVAPTQGKEILAGIASAIPTLKAPLAKAMMASNPEATPTVASVLDSVPATLDLSPSIPMPVASAGSAVAPPSYGPPYVPLSGTPVNLNPGTGGEVPTGGRDYASP